MLIYLYRFAVEFEMGWIKAAAVLAAIFLIVTVSGNLFDATRKKKFIKNNNLDFKKLDSYFIHISQSSSFKIYILLNNVEHKSFLNFKKDLSVDFEVVIQYAPRLLSKAEKKSYNDEGPLTFNSDHVAFQLSYDHFTPSQMPMEALDSGIAEITKHLVERGFEPGNPLYSRRYLSAWNGKQKYKKQFPDAYLFDA